jgi:hypothetical protein
MLDANARWTKYESGLELFEEGEVGRTRDRVHVTLSGDGHIYFSGRAVEALGRPEGGVAV